MNKRILIFLVLLFPIFLTAQENKQFTLDELIPGGRDFYRFTPHMEEQFQWWGDRLIISRQDSVFVVSDPAKSDQKTLLFTLRDISEDNNRVFQASFDAEGGSKVRLRTSQGISVYDMNEQKTVASFAFPTGSNNHSLSPGYNFLAFTKKDNLYLIDASGSEFMVAEDESPDILFGTSVHRDEFGISKGIFWSPDGRKLAFYRMDQTMVEDYPLVDISAREAALKAIKYPMAGMTSHEVTVGVFDTQTQKVTYLQTGDTKNRYLTNVEWNPQSDAIYIAELNRGQDHMQLKRYDAVSGEFKQLLFEEKHPKYVEPENPVIFVKGSSEQFVWQSKRDGYNHLYLYDISGQLIKQLTSGDWEVTYVIGFDQKGDNLFFVATQANPMDRHLCSVNLKKGKLTAHAHQPGMHSGSVSNSGRYLVDKYSAHNSPGIVDLIDIRTKKSVTLASAPNPFEGYNVPAVESGTIKAADEVTDLHYRLVKPVGFDASKKYPVVIYVYGGPHSQLVQNRWRYGSGGWEFYMAQKGYLVFTMDNRGTAYRGMEFEQVTHRNLGVEEVKDQMKGVDFLKSLSFVDSDRIGVHGWSYGGFMTINMLLRHPDVFKAGVAGGPVTDWKYYEIMYGERYMDSPEDNPEGYEETSLLNKAGNLKSRLLIIHGDEDPVVVMQHSLQFLKSAIKSGTHPDFFVYPGHGHNMTGADRVHLHEHITRYFDDFM